MKKCTKCKEEKPVSEFYRQSMGRPGYTAWCKKCKGLWSAEWTRRNPESKQNSHRRSRYGMEPREYALLLERFSSKCGICQRSTRLEVDHCHHTQKVRGILCGQCNTALGLLKDSPSLLRKALEYLEKTKTADDE